MPVWVSLSSRSQHKAGREFKLWLMQEKRGRLATGFSPAFWGGEAAGFACPTGACWLVCAGRPVGKRYGPQLARARWQSLCHVALLCTARLARGQPQWCVPSLKKGFTCLGERAGGAACQDAPVVLTGAPGRLETVSFGVRALAGTQNLG